MTKLLLVSLAVMGCSVALASNTTTAQCDTSGECQHGSLLQAVKSQGICQVTYWSGANFTGDSRTIQTKSGRPSLEYDFNPFTIRSLNSSGCEIVKLQGLNLLDDTVQVEIKEKNAAIELKQKAMIAMYPL